MAVAAAAEVEADAFKRLYPEQFFDRFLSAGVRPDGRPIGRARAVTVGMGAVSSVDGSALVKIGSSSALAGVRMEVMRPDELAPSQGQLTVAVEFAAFASPDYRPGRPLERASATAQALSDVLLSSEVVQLSSLCIAEGKAAWRAILDVYVLDADGCELDVALLASVAALRSTRVPGVRGTKEGHFYRAGDRAGGSGSGPAGLVAGPSRITLQRLPLCLTCCLHKGHVLVDPTRDEESLASCSVSVVVDEHGQLLAVLKVGGRALADVAVMAQCVEAAKMRHKAVLQIMEHSLQAHEQQGPGSQG